MPRSSLSGRLEIMPALPDLFGRCTSGRAELLNRDRGYKVAERRSFRQGDARCQSAGNAGAGTVAGAYRIDRATDGIRGNSYRLNACLARVCQQDALITARTEDRPLRPAGQ